MITQKPKGVTLGLCGVALSTMLFLIGQKSIDKPNIESANALESDIENVRIPDSKWTVTPYIIKPKDDGTKNIDDITFPNGLNGPATRYQDQSDEESTVAERAQAWEIYVFYGGNSYEKITTPNLDKDNTRLREILKVTDDRDFYRMVIRANHHDLRFVLLGRHTEGLSDDVMKSFDLNLNIPDDVISQLKASYTRAKIAEDNLRKIDASYKSDLGDLIETLDSDYTKLKTIYEGQGNKHYMPNIVIDPDAYLTGLTTDELDDIKTKLQQIPFDIRRSLIDVHFVGDKNNDDMAGILGYAYHSKTIRLNTQYNGLDETLWHEMGHIFDSLSFVYKNRELVNSFSRSDDFKKVWRASNITHDYYKDSYVETFAEGFGRFIQVKYLGHDKSIFNDFGGDLIYGYMDNLIDNLYPHLKATPVSPEAPVVTETETETVTPPVSPEAPVVTETETETVTPPVAPEVPVVTETETETVTPPVAPEVPVVTETETETVTTPVVPEVPVVTETETETVTPPVAPEVPVVTETETETVTPPVAPEVPVVTETETETVTTPVVPEVPVVTETETETVTPPVAPEVPVVTETETETVTTPVVPEVPVVTETATETVTPPVAPEVPVVTETATETVTPPVAPEVPVVTETETETVTTPVVPEVPVVTETETETVTTPVVPEAPVVTETATETVTTPVVPEAPVVTETVTETVTTPVAPEVPVVTETVTETVTTPVVPEVPVVTETEDITPDTDETINLNTMDEHIDNGSCGCSFCHAVDVISDVLGDKPDVSQYISQTEFERQIVDAVNQVEPLVTTRTVIVKPNNIDTISQTSAPVLTSNVLPQTNDNQSIWMSVLGVITLGIVPMLSQYRKKLN